MLRRLRLRTFLLLLPFGAIVNVAVAWGCAYWIDLLEFQKRGTCFGSWREQQQLRQYPEEIQQFIEARRGPIMPGEWHVVRREYALWTDSHGLPMQSMSSCAYVSPFWHLSGPAMVLGPLCDVQLDGIPLKPDPPTGMLVCTWQLPLRPIWPGFAINTLFYTAILQFLVAIPFALRRHRRMKRNVCPECAYPIGTSPVCTECGGDVWAIGAPLRRIEGM